MTALERDDPRAALALYKVVASVNTAIANRCKMALGRMADAAFDNRGPRVDSELRFLLVVLTYLLLDARNASSIMFWIDDIIRCCWGMEAAPAFAVPSLRRCIWNSQVGSPGFGWW